ncbi:MAG: tyrosine-type recombinase/integrase [Candidatus Atabeyarchaeum deiterrae]
MEKEIQAFLSQLRLSDTSDHTPRQYEYTLRMFRRFLGTDKDIKQIGKQDVAAFLEFLSRPSQDRPHKNAYKRSSIIAVRACLSSFFQYMMDTDRMVGNPMPRAGRMSRPPRNPVYLTEAEKDRLLKAAKTPRDKLVLNLLVSTGMRMGELLGVRVRDIDLEGVRVRVRLKRGAVRQYIIVPALVSEDMPRLVKRHIADENLDQNDLLIDLSRRGLQYLVENAAKRAKINKKLSPHKLRHTFAVELRRRGLRTVDLQNLLHHKNRETTAIYEDVDMRETEEELIRLKLLSKQLEGDGGIEA